MEPEYPSSNTESQPEEKNPHQEIIDSVPQEIRDRLKALTTTPSSSFIRLKDDNGNPLTPEEQLKRTYIQHVLNFETLTSLKVPPEEALKKIESHIKNHNKQSLENKE